MIDSTKNQNSLAFTCGAAFLATIGYSCAYLFTDIDPIVGALCGISVKIIDHLFPENGDLLTAIANVFLSATLMQGICSLKNIPISFSACLILTTITTFALVPLSLIFSVFEPKTSPSPQN